MSGRRKFWRADMTATQAASTRPPSWSRKWTSTRTLQTSFFARMHSDSRSSALALRKVLSSVLDNNNSYGPTRAGSKDDAAMGENSVEMVNIPSNGESSYGLTTFADTCAMTLLSIPHFRSVDFVFPSSTYAHPNVSPKDRARGRVWDNPLPSRRRSFCNAPRVKFLVFNEGSRSRGISYTDSSCQNTRKTNGQRRICRT